MLAFGLTVFLSAFLLFQVQLVIAKYILPWFGGPPAVWTTCMLFFQVALLGGYAYSHLLASRLRPRRQGRLHAALLASSLGVLLGQLLVWGWPLLPPANWKPGGSDLPVLRVLGLLAISVGLPFFILSTTSALLQAWSARTHPDRSPYRLYALSNAGSLLGLATYPFLVEPALTLKSQAAIWSACYTGFALCCGWCSVRAGRAQMLGAELGRAPGPRDDTAVPQAQVGRPGRLQRLLWLGLSACASVLLLATTNQMSEEIAVVPFLWALPLGLYLLSLIFCFSSDRAYSRRLFIATALVAMLLVGFMMYRKPERISIVMHLWVSSLALFVCCMICHGELVRLKPAPRHLTSFYLTLAAGGAMGGAFAAVVAPSVFSGLWELYVGYFGCGALLVAAMLRDANSRLNARRRWLWRAAAGVVLATLVVGSVERAQDFHRDTLRVRRNFYGILRVREETEGAVEWRRRLLYHARTVHGLQFVNPARRRLPTAYYTEESGGALAILHHPRRQSGARLRIGVVGLGAGTLAVYGRMGDCFRFYEINPAVVELASGLESSFTFLKDSPAKSDIVLGDARISLERELTQKQPQDFDLLILDAFSGGAVPLHLLTREAFDIYLRHLRDGGFLVVHGSNRYFDLTPVLFRMATDLDLGAVSIVTRGDGTRSLGAVWVLLSADRELLRKLAQLATREDTRIEWSTGEEPGRLWTDDYSNLFQLLK